MKLPPALRTRWTRLARKNVGDARRSWSLHGTVGLFVLVGGLMGYFSGNVPGGAAVSLTAGLMSVLVPVVALGLTYESVVGPRTDGSLQFLLALPYGRRDVVAGTYAGRVAVLGAGVVAGYLTFGIAALLTGGSVQPATFLAVASAVLVLGVAFVAIGVGVSAGVRSTTAAGGLGFVAFVLAFGVWGSLPGLIATALNGFSPAPPPDWAPLFRTLNPVASFRILLASVADVGGAGSGVLDSLPLAAAVLAGWATLAPIAGYLRLRGEDL
jgi:ABC-2 type transport system permease protein